MKEDFLQKIVFAREILDEVIKQYATKEVAPDTGPALPDSPLDAIFHNALYLPKVKEGLYTILHLTDGRGKPLFRHQKLWYVVHRVFVEMGWLDNRKATCFRRWAEEVYGKQGHSTKSDWDGVNPYYKNKPSRQWTPGCEADRPYTEVARAMWQKFWGADGKNETLFMKPDRFIWHRDMPRR